MTRAPAPNWTIKHIAEALNISVDRAALVRGLFDGKISPNAFRSVDSWVRQCYNPPSYHDRKMMAFNEILEGYGGEAIFGDDPYHPDIEYVNMGDTYIMTILYNRIDGRYRITNWGDELEAMERRGRHYQ